MKPKPLLRYRTEADFTKDVIGMAHDYGWKVARFHRLPTKDAQWRTPVGADAKGFPDLTCVRERLLFAELKLRPNKPSADQRKWLDWLATAGCEVYLWNDGDLDEIEQTFKTAVTPRRLAELTLACDGNISDARAIARMR